ncbi:uncharacterized protein LOC125652703 [Ostrea edulis]|uniref:uncharacterized protein LOC125652703 n=1 Tax=Ostrea edulis TaxID=37623 RepID=UPI0024AF6CB8|nr:uncharacterized protein LOC125652703 [Ostrea edulis]XP_056022724.1 uncharacterized protein LOC125652703 [Ostrea edulis]
MPQIKWQSNYEVNLIYSFNVTRLSIIVLILNVLVWYILPTTRLYRHETGWSLVCFVGVTTLTCLVVFKFESKSESLQVIPAVGVSVTIVNRLGQVYTEFFPRQLVRDVVIVEGIRMQRLATYLVIMHLDPSTGQTKLKPLFAKSRLKMEDLISIYQKVQKNLEFTSEMKS